MPTQRNTETTSRNSVFMESLKILADGQPRMAKQISAELAVQGIIVDKSLVNSVLSREGRDEIYYDRTTFTYTARNHLSQQSTPNSMTSAKIQSTNDRELILTGVRKLLSDGQPRTLRYMVSELASLGIIARGSLIENIMTLEGKDEFSFDTATRTYEFASKVPMSAARKADQYDIWNHALISCILAGVQRGSSIFLSVDEDILRKIAHDIAEVGHDKVDDFCQAVQQRVTNNGQITLVRVRGRNRDGEPNCVAFLAAMVLAATRMADDGEITQSNYFKRLREVLNIPPGAGRPPGLGPGAEAEEPLWKDWALWLQENGFLPSARGGEGGTAHAYIRYPISQALLRQADKDRIRRLFGDKHWYYDWDAETLIAKVRRESGNLTQHLQDLLNSPSDRFRAVADTIHDLFEDWKLDPHVSHVDSTGSHSPLIYAGLFRAEDAVSGNIEFYLYPRSPRGRKSIDVQVWISGTLHSLVAERPGWYMPVAPITEGDLKKGRHYDVEQPSDFDSLVLPQRQFWLLIPDPEDPDSGNYGSWGVAPLGTPFILLCQIDLLPQLELLRAEKLIEWSGEPRRISEDGVWIELQYCMVVADSESWSAVFIENEDLFEALRPSLSISLSFSGGLRVPQVGGWFEGQGPQVTVISTQSEADLAVIRIKDEYRMYMQSVQTRTPISVDWLELGDYRVEAQSGGDVAERLVKIVPWEELRSKPVEKYESIDIGQWTLSGAFIVEK